MKFMMMHKMTEAMESGAPPEPEMLAEIHAMIGEALEKKIFLSGEGLKPSSQRLHLSYRSGKRELTQGPFSDPRELPDGFALLRVDSQEQALRICDDFAELVGDVELYLGPVVEPWDMNMGERPADAPLRFVAMHRQLSSPGTAALSADLMAKMQTLIEQMSEAGVLQAAGGLAGTERGARIRNDGGKHVICDGPFAESKELIAGYAIMELPDKATAIEWGRRFLDIVKVNEVDIRQLAE